MRNASGVAVGNFTFADVPIGGGGYSTAMEPNPWGDLLMGTDTAGCYARRVDDPAWAEVFTTDTMTEADYYPRQAKSVGAYSTNWVAWAPSNRSRLYAAINSFVFKVVIDPAKELNEAGAITCTRWNLAAKYMDAGAGWNRWITEGLAVHPTNADTVLLGTNNDGCYYTTNGGATVTQVANIPAGSGLVLGALVLSREVGRERYLVWIDQGDPNYCYIFVQGTGLYRSTAGVSGSFNLVSGGPTSASALGAGANGTLWICGDNRIGAQGGVWKIARGSSTFTSYGNPIGGTNYPIHIRVDPFDNNCVICWREQPGCYTTNGGTSWSAQQSAIGVAGGEAVWHQPSAPKLGGGMAFDPLVQNRTFWAEGFGAMKSDAYKVPQISLSSFVAGTEQKIHTGFLSIPDGPLFVTGMDRVVTRLDSLTSYTNLPVAGPVEAADLQPAGNPPDYAIDDPDYLVLSLGYGDNHSYNANGGDPDKWHKFAGERSTTVNAYGYDATGSLGDIAVSNKNNTVLAPSGDAVPSYTLDAGVTWNRIALGGSYDYSTNHAYYIRGRKIVASDKTRPGVFAMVVMTANPNTSVYTNPRGGLWVTTNGGVDWTQKQVGVIAYSGMTYAQVLATGQDPRQYYHCQISYVPGRSQELLYTPHADFTNDKFFYSTNDGATWSEPNTLVRNVTSFAFGKHYDDSAARPVVYFYGDYNGVTGLWVTFDWFVTFTQISGRFPAGYISGVAAVGADMNVFGRCLSTCEGKGSVYTIHRDVARAT